MNGRMYGDRCMTGSTSEDVVAIVAAADALKTDG